MAVRIKPETDKPVVLRASTGATVLRDLSNEVVGVTLEDAVRLNASAVTAQGPIGQNVSCDLPTSHWL